MKYRPLPERETVVEMARGGKPPAQIAEETGLSIYTVTGDIQWARASGIDIPSFRVGPRRRRTYTLKVSSALTRRLGDQAAARGLTARELAERLLSRIAEDGLTGAILDDGGENAD